jgi:hypothetical protein
MFKLSLWSLGSTSISRHSSFDSLVSDPKLGFSTLLALSRDELVKPPSCLGDSIV